MIISTFKFVVLRERRSELLEILNSIQGPIAAQPGCLSCCIYTEVGSNRSIVFCEHWQSEDRLHEHIRSSIYLRVLAAAELSSTAPEVRFYRVADTQDMGLIRQLRNNSGD